MLFGPAKISKDRPPQTFTLIFFRFAEVLFLRALPITVERVVIVSIGFEAHGVMCRLRGRFISLALGVVVDF